MLHRIMACDPRFYAPIWYEARYPAPFTDYDFTGEDTRISVAKAEVQQMIEANPDLAAIHPLDACAVDEEILLLEHSFYSTVPESFANIPSYAHYLEAHDNTPAYLYMRKLLQFLQWQKKKKGQHSERWLLKTPHHLHHLDILLQVFPDATIIQTHRDPLQTIPSLCSLNYALATMSSDSADKIRIGQHWCDKFARSLNRAMAVRQQYPDQFVDVSYKDTVENPLVVIKRLYRFLGIELDDEAQAAMVHWQRDNKREDREVHRYTIEQFGFTQESLDRDFATYRDTYLS